jgi:cytochrome b
MTQTSKSVLVWDLPVRLFHWLLVSLMIVAWIAAEEGGGWMVWHLWCGYGVLTLILFRILWGFFGSHYARFSDFIYSPRQVIHYATHLFRPFNLHYIGHNPIGGWSVVFLLTFSLIQAVTGLFADDDIVTQGPLANWVSGEISRWLTSIHKLNFDILLILIGLHLSAIAFYWIVKKQNLVLPMLTGRKTIFSEDSMTEYTFVSYWRALFLLGMVIAIIALLVLRG